MAPRLIAIDGPVKGAIFNLNENQILLGRAASNTIHLNDLSVSRRHCVIKREPVEQPQQTASREQTGNQINAESGEVVTSRPPTFEFTIVDLESYNRTFVNDVPIHERKLAHGDEIAVGDVRLLFLIHEAEAGTTPPLQAGEGDLITRSTVRLRSEDALYLHPEKSRPNYHNRIASSGIFPFCLKSAVPLARIGVLLTCKSICLKCFVASSLRNGQRSH